MICFFSIFVMMMMIIEIFQHHPNPSDVPHKSPLEIPLNVQFLTILLGSLPMDVFCIKDVLCGLNALCSISSPYKEVAAGIPREDSPYQSVFSLASCWCALFLMYSLVLAQNPFNKNRDTEFGGLDFFMVYVQDSCHLK